MKVLLALAAFALVAIGCSTTPPRASDSSLSKLPSEELLGTWTFTVENAIGTRTATFLFTDKPAKTCASGDWYRAEIVSAAGFKPMNPAYTYSNGHLEVLVTNGICGERDSLVGTISGSMFRGAHVSFGQLFGNAEHGKATGSRRP